MFTACGSLGTRILQVGDLLTDCVNTRLQMEAERILSGRYRATALCGDLRSGTPRLAGQSHGFAAL